MIEMTSLFAGVLSRASSTVINIGASIWVMDPAVQTVANTIPVPDYVLDEVRSIPGVKYAVPLYSGAALLPSVSLNGDYSANGLWTGKLLSASGRAWSVGADASAPLFRGGTLWFKRKAAIDDYRQASALYRQTVLGAFGQVADTLRALDHDAAALVAQDAALEAAGQALHLVQVNYSSGLGNYLDVLNADAQFHQAKINDLQAVAVRYQDTVALYVALGGGWWTAQRG